MIKLKRLHSKLAHYSHYNNHFHDSSRSEYGYGEYRIRSGERNMDWNVYLGETKLTPTVIGRSFKEAKEWLENYIKTNDDIK